MNETWWLEPGQLDETQRSILIEPPESEMYIDGPPGSGKTNILLLRANYVREISPRLLLVTFTRTLTEFLRSGPNVGRGDQIQREEILTFMSLAHQLIKQFGGSIPEKSGDFDTDRSEINAYLSSLLEEQNVGKLYDVIFLDEAQSFTEEELQIIRRLTERINAAGDLRQRIFGNRAAIPTVVQMVDKVVELKEHYRIGEEVCRLADQVMPSKPGVPPLLEGCNYNEEERPSSVDEIECADENEQFAECLELLKTQLRYIPDEPIGVLSWKAETRDRFWDALVADGELGPISLVQRQEEYLPFGPNSRIRVMTIASAQGSEFRAVHLLNSQEFRPAQRELAFTAVTRAKTELALYHTGALSGHMRPPKRELRQLGEIF